MKNNVYEAKIKDLIFDDKNANKHNEKGMRLLEKSLSKYGGARSIVLDKNKNIIAGNGVIETAGNIGMEDVIVVPSDGSKIIAVQRTDIDINTKKGRELALADNNTAKQNIEFDFEVIGDLSKEFDIDLIDLEMDYEVGFEFLNNVNLEDKNNNKDTETNELLVCPKCNFKWKP